MHNAQICFHMKNFFLAGIFYLRLPSMFSGILNPGYTVEGF